MKYTDSPVINAFAITVAVILTCGVILFSIWLITPTPIPAPVAEINTGMFSDSAKIYYELNGVVIDSGYIGIRITEFESSSRAYSAEEKKIIFDNLKPKGKTDE